METALVTRLLAYKRLRCIRLFSSFPCFAVASAYTSSSLIPRLPLSASLVGIYITSPLLFQRAGWVMHRMSMSSSVGVLAASVVVCRKNRSGVLWLVLEQCTASNFNPEVLSHEHASSPSILLDIRYLQRITISISGKTASFEVGWSISNGGTTASRLQCVVSFALSTSFTKGINTELVFGLNLYCSEIGPSKYSPFMRQCLPGCLLSNVRVFVLEPLSLDL